MTLCQINCFLRAAEMKSFSKAAEVLYITRPAVSKQVAQLEEELGFPLFIRNSGGLEITEPGKTVYASFRQASESMEQAIAQGRHLYHQNTDRIRIGCLWGWDYKHIFAPALSYLEERLPGLRMELEGYGHLDMLPALEKGLLDYVIGIDSFFASAPKLQTRRIASTGSTLIYSNWHPVAEMEQPSILNFRDDTFLIPGAEDYSSATAERITAYCRTKGFHPEIEYVGDGTIIRRIQNGKGVFVADDWFASASNSLVRSMPVDIEYTVSIGWLPSVSTLKWNEQFLSALFEFCDSYELSNQTK